MFFSIYISLNAYLIKKSTTAARYLSTYEYELSDHLACFNNSYYSNAHAALCYMGVCCNSPLLGRKGGEL